MTHLAFESVAAGPLLSISVTFESGLHVVLGKDGAALDALGALATGELKPRRGRVHTRAGEPHRTPEARRAVACLRASEVLPPAPTVREAVATVLRLRGLDARVEEVLARAGHPELETRALTSLHPAEVRSIALALALVDARAEILVLYEPFATALAPSKLITLLRALAEDQVVLVTTSSLADARALGGAWYVLDAGTLTLAPPWMRGGSTSRLRVSTAQARELSALLSAEPSVSAISWNAQRSPSELVVTTSDPHAFGAALARLSNDNGIAIDALVPVAPPLEAALAERAGYLQAAYEHAYREAAHRYGAAPQSGSTLQSYSPASHQYQSPHLAPPNQSVTVVTTPHSTFPDTTTPGATTPDATIPEEPPKS